MTPALTAGQPNAALRLCGLFCGAGVDNIVASVVSSYGREVSGQILEKLLNYIRLLASAGKTDEQLLTLGAAYLREAFQPDPRYTGW
jgi:hypothetical protein